MSRVTLCVLHSTEGKNAHDAMDWVNRPHSDAPSSAHYYVDRDGDIYRSVKIERVAYHAGVSEWPIESLPIPPHRSVNVFSLGIEIAGDTGGVPKMTQAQFLSLVWLCQWVRDTLHIQPLMFRGHREVAPGRKIDPRPLFLDLDWFRTVIATGSDEEEIWMAYCTIHGVAYVA
jgi:N-acetyl-anhydromuramyl-L-alanine amidase AmpD